MRCLISKSAVSAHNLGEYVTALVVYQQRLINYLPVISVNTSQPVCVCALSHFFTTHSGVHLALLHCARFGPLQLMVLSKAHISAKQRASFHPDLRMLGAIFFCPIYQNTSPTRRPFLICTTARNSHNNHAHLVGLTGTSLLSKYYC